MRVTRLIPFLIGTTLAVKSAPAGPDKLSQCGCSPITDKMAQCQSVKGVDDNIRECLCIPKDDPDSPWYGGIRDCRICLEADNDDDNDTFFHNLSGAISQLSVSCSFEGGSIVSDGASICERNDMFELCLSLNAGRSSWASFRSEGKSTNATFLLNIDAADSGSSTSSPSSSSPDAGITAPTQPATGTGTATYSTATVTSTTTSSARVLLHPQTRVGGLVALLAAFSISALGL
ncbi:hypothetical protein V8F20_009342 [Naviculisporaceae sp. PSN 640]